MDVREKLVELLSNIYLPMMAGPDTIGEYRIPHKFKEKIADYLISNGVTVQEWISVEDRLPEKDGQYLIFTTQYFTPDHIDEIDHKDGIEISRYHNIYGFLSENGMHAKYWCEMPQPPKGE